MRVAPYREFYILDVMARKVVVLDVDGVLNTPNEPFSWSYAREHGLDKTVFRPFFQGAFQDTLIGKADLRELLKADLENWRWSGSVDELLLLWFDTEHVPNQPMVSAVNKLKSREIACYFATNQDKRRAKYMRSVMFGEGMFDGEYVSAEIGVKKPDQAFFKYMLNDLTAKYPGLTPSDILFIDDTPEHVQAAKKLGFDAHHYTKQSAETIHQILHGI